MPLRNSKREPRDRRREIPIGGKIRNFRPTSRCIMETVQERAVVTMECWWEVLRSLSNRAISDDLEWPRNVTFNVKHLSMAYISTALCCLRSPKYWGSTFEGHLWSRQRWNRVSDTDPRPDPGRQWPVTRWPGLTRCFGGVQAYWPNLVNYGLV